MTNMESSDKEFYESSTKDNALNRNQQMQSLVKGRKND